MNLVRQLVIAFTVAAVPATALADPVIGVEWENLEYSVYTVSGNAVAADMLDEKKLLCTKATTKAFTADLPMVTVTYDLPLTAGEARLEISTSPIGVGDSARWKQASAYIRGFLGAGLDHTLEEALASLGSGWDYCNPTAKANAKNLRFALARSPASKTWDTQVNFQVALSDLEWVYGQVKGDVIHLPLNGKNLVKVFDVVEPLLPKGLTDTERGLVLLYYMFRAYADLGTSADGRHSSIKNRFALFPKVLMHELVAQTSKELTVDKVGKAIVALELDPGLAKSELTLATDPELVSFTKDRFRVGEISNPISPYVDRKGEIFFVLEVRNPNDNLNLYMYPADPSGSDFHLKTSALCNVGKKLGKLTVPAAESKEEDVGETKKKDCLIQ